MMKHLWEVDHPYYCNLGNFYSNEPGHEYKSFADFLAEWGENDMDLNLVFRFDWKEEEDRPHKGDDNYRNGKLEIFWMLQRKGIYTFTVVEVCRADEPAVIEFLSKRWKYLSELWAPLNTMDSGGAK